MGSVTATACTPKTPNTVSTTITTIKPTAISTPIGAIQSAALVAAASTKRDENDLAAKVNNINVASNALPHGTNSSFSNTN